MLNFNPRSATPADTPKRSTLILLLLAGYLLFMLALAPLSLLLQPWAQTLKQQPTVLAGNLWRGQLIGGERFFGLRDLQWDAQPAALWRGRLQYQLAAGQQTAIASVGLSPWGTLHVAQLQLDGRLSDLVDSLNGVPLVTDVAIQGGLRHGAWAAGECQRLEAAEFKLKDWSGVMAGLLNELGELHAEFRCDEGVLTGQLRGRSAHPLDGSLSLSAEGEYRLEINIQTATPALQQSLINAGFIRRQNRLTLSRQGRLS